MSKSIAERFRRAAVWLPIWVIVIVSITASVNRQLIGLIAQSVKVEFGLSDTQLGGIISVVGIVVALIVPLLAHISDKFDRHKFMLVSIFVWSFGTATYGLATGYIGLCISFLAIVLAETSVVPLFNSIIADRYRDEQRIQANLIYFAAGGLTTGVGSFIGGLLLHWSAHNMSSVTHFWPGASEWRVAMIATGLIGVPLACMTLILGKDQRQSNHKLVSKISYFADYWKKNGKSVVYFYLSNAGYFICASATMGWTTIYLLRHFGMTPAELGMRIGIVIGIADVFGIILGFIAIKKLYRVLGPVAPRYIFQFSICCIALTYIPLMAAKTSWTFLVFLGVQNFFATFGTASFSNMAQDLSMPGVRAKIFSVGSLISSLAFVPGPLLVGMISDHLGQDPRVVLWSIIIVSVPALFMSFLLYSLTNKNFLLTVQTLRALEQDQQAKAG